MKFWSGVAVGLCVGMVPIYHHWFTNCSIRDEDLIRSGKLIKVNKEFNIHGEKKIHNDTLFVMPLNASRSFHGGVTYLIETGKIKVTGMQP